MRGTDTGDQTPRSEPGQSVDAHSEAYSAHATQQLCIGAVVVALLRIGSGIDGLLM